MLGTSIYLCDGVILAVRGRRRGGRLEIVNCASVPIPEDCLVRGEIRDAAYLQQGLLETVKRLGGEIRGADVLVNNGLIRMKTVKLPKMSPSQIRRFVRMEMGFPCKDPGEYSFDYSILNADRKSQLILCGAMRKEWQNAYRRLFEECGIGLCSLGPALMGLIRLAGFLPEWKDKNLLLAHQEDGENVLLALFSSGRYLAFNRIFCREGVCSEKGRRQLLGQITAFCQMQEIQNAGFTPNGVVLCGGFHEEGLLLQELIAALGEKVWRLEESRAVDVKRVMDGEYRLAEFVCVTGNLLRR